ARGPDTKERARGVDGRAPGNIAEAIALREEERPVLDHCYCGACYVFVAKIGGHDAVEECGELAAIANTARRRGYGGSRTEDLLFFARRRGNERVDRWRLGRRGRGEGQKQGEISAR